METHLIEEYEDLYLAIKRKATEELALPIIVGNSIIGFGNYLDFYMFWIGEIDGSLYFSVRKRFCKSKKDNIVRFPLSDENKESILDAITTIYNHYTEAKESGALEEESPHIGKVKKEEKKKSTSTKEKNQKRQCRCSGTA